MNKNQRDRTPTNPWSMHSELFTKKEVFLGAIEHSRRSQTVNTSSEDNETWFGPPSTGKTATSSIPTIPADTGSRIVNDPLCEVLTVLEGPAAQPQGEGDREELFWVGGREIIDFVASRLASTSEGITLSKLQ